MITSSAVQKIDSGHHQIQIRRFHIEEKWGEKVWDFPPLAATVSISEGPGVSFHVEPSLSTIAGDGPQGVHELTYSWIDQWVKDRKLLASGYWHLLV